MEPGTNLTILGVAIGSAKLLEKLLEKIFGPTATYLGEGIQQFTEKRVRNIDRILSKAKDKLGDKIDIDETVPSKVIKGIIVDGSFCEDELTAEYFGGVLASSRGPVSRDDRGASFLELINRLSVYQIRSHYIFYHIIIDLFHGENISIANIEDRKKTSVFIPYEVFKTAMDFHENEDMSVLTPHILFGLQKEDLIVRNFRYGELKFIKNTFNQANSGGIIFTPSALGVELFLWAYGKSNISIKEFMKCGEQFERIGNITITEGSKKLISKGL